MKLKTILQALHSSDDSKVIETLNTAIKLDPFSYWSKENRSVIHSGFRFSLHSGESVDLLIDLAPNNPALLWQESMTTLPLPLILGLCLTLGCGGYKSITCNLVTGCSRCNSESTEVEIGNSPDLNIDQRGFEIYIKSSPKLFAAFPLSREYHKKLFYGAQGFTTNAEFHREFDSQVYEYYYQENQYYNHRHEEEDAYNSEDINI